MKIINLIEDTQGEDGCVFEHGLSFYIETAHHKLLCDTGATDAFIRNADKKKIDLTAVDTVVISHGHYDHTGGLLAFLKLNSKARVYIQKNAMGEFYNLKNGLTKYIGMDKEIALSQQVSFVDGDLKIDDEISLFSAVNGKRLVPWGNKSLKIRQGEKFAEDDFCHEQYLVVREGDKSILISGCAHKGILNILDRYTELYKSQPDYVISGFHTTKQCYTEEDIELIETTALELAKTETVFYSGHCTGEYPLSVFKRIMGERLTIIHSGDDIL